MLCNGAETRLPECIEVADLWKSLGAQVLGVDPADDKKTARLLVSQVIVETLEGMGLRYPSVDLTILDELKKQLEM